MKTILRLKTYILSFHFYKQFIPASLLITGILYLALFEFKGGTILGILTLGKFFLMVFAFLMYFETKLNQELTFYNNFGISKLHLFVNAFLIDMFLTTIIVLIIRTF